ncbi:hypothetical protein BVU17_10275 [Haloarcula taiwanensis]|uniref:DUF7968 domain-containing protein n=1 Tax=Haloarcula taiwanensis TaxID=1932004 RepID=A0A2H4ZZH5_9EURY|nr:MULTISPECIES: hypothetical protein [Haloarcula]AUG47882.1 hypothetical protein BVU17_10275 [Haloarcula taiwanensis]RLM39191.1 hypothetical protein DVK01_01130 [Haloarcula sp. Atlit-120R]RLM47136.1 hypothetical protein DVK00_01130 [Haloarcula sp. Atlit-47R]
MASVAARIVLSFAPNTTDGDPWSGVDTEWIADELRGDTYQQYLRRAHSGPVAVGEEWDEFVSCGCATPQDVVLRVERVEAGTAVGDETTLDVHPRNDTEAVPQ